MGADYYNEKIFADRCANQGQGYTKGASFFGDKNATYMTHAAPGGYDVDSDWSCNGCQTDGKEFKIVLILKIHYGNYHQPWPKYSPVQFHL
jgi:hypothetical protein